MKKWLVGLALIATLAVACSGGGSASDEEAITKTVTDFQKALSSNKARDAYDLVDSGSREQCPLVEFTAMLAILAVFLDEDSIKVDEVRDIKVDGNSATALVVTSVDGEPGDPETTNFVKEDGKWRISFDEGCEDFDADSDLALDDPTPRPSGTATATPVIRSARDSRSPVSGTLGGVTVTVVNVTVSDYDEFYQAQSSSFKRDLDSSDEAEGAVTAGKITLKVENNSGKKINFYPESGVIVAGSEQVDMAFFLGDVVGGTLFDGVLREGSLYFFLKRVPVSEITYVTFAVDAPYDDDTYTDLGDDIELRIDLAPR